MKELNRSLHFIAVLLKHLGLKQPLNRRSFRRCVLQTSRHEIYDFTELFKLFFKITKKLMKNSFFDRTRKSVPLSESVDWKILLKILPNVDLSIALTIAVSAGGMYLI